MKKALSSLMVISMFCSSAFAGTGSLASDHTQAISKAFDGFRYAMTVQVAPNDSSAQDRAIADFKGKLAELQSQGVTPEELMNFMRASILDSATLVDFDRLVSTIDQNGVSAEDASAMVTRFMESKYQQGANYSGGGKGGMNPALIVVGVVIAGAITYIVIKHIRAMHPTDNCPFPSNNGVTAQ